MAIKRTKTTTTTIRLTPQELSHIQKKADEAGVTRKSVYSEYGGIKYSDSNKSPCAVCAEGSSNIIIFTAF